MSTLKVGVRRFHSGNTSNIRELERKRPRNSISKVAKSFHIILSIFFLSIDEKVFTLRMLRMIGNHDSYEKWEEIQSGRGLWQQDQEDHDRALLFSFELLFVLP